MRLRAMASTAPEFRGKARANWRPFTSKPWTARPLRTARPFPTTHRAANAWSVSARATPAGNLPVYRVWMTQATFKTWSARNKLNNAPLNVTFVLGDSRVIYNAQALYAGQPVHRARLQHAHGQSLWIQPYLPGRRPFPGQQRPGSRLARRAWKRKHGHARADGLLDRQQDRPPLQPPLYHPPPRQRRDGMDRGSVFEAINQPAGDFVRAWSPDAAEGDFYKIERAFEFNDGGGLISDSEPRLENYTTVGGAKKTARYRWNWVKRSTDALNDYTNIFELVDAVNAPSPEPYTSQTEALVDLEEWMGMLAVEHIIVNFDAYGHEIGKNMYAYKPDGGKWQLYMFDLDWLMLAAINHRSNYAPAVAPLFNADDPKIVRMFNHPPFLRAYYRTIKKAVDGPLVGANCNPVMDAKYQSLVANGVFSAMEGTWRARRR